MADVTFDVTHVFRHAAALAQRSAVIRPVSATPDLTKDGAVEAAVGKVVELWRRRCNVLREAGLPVMQGPRFQYARNCPPVAVKCRPAGAVVHPCRMGSLCPWCWARQVVENAWDKVRGGMLRLGTLGTGEDPYKLVLATRVAREPDGGRMPAPLFDVVNGTMDRNKRALRAKGAVGSLMLSVVQPGKPTARKWVYGTRALALVPQDYVPPPGTEVAPPTKRGVAVLVAKFARYPMGLMLGDPEMVVRLMEVRGGHRLLRAAGAFYAGEAGAAPPADGRFLDL